MGLSDEKSAGVTPQDPIVYPKVEKDSGSKAYETGRWGTYTMGSTWEPIPGYILDQQDQSRGWGSSSSSGHGAGTANPYITTLPAPAFTGKSPMDIITDYLSKWRQKFEEVAKKAEEAAGNVWQHLKTGPNMADTAWGRLSQGTRLLTEGGFEKMFRQTFETSPDEELRKSYACYLSTSSGPVAGTLYLSNERVAFCSDRPLSYEPSPGQRAWSYYKVVVPLEKLAAANPSSNPNNLSEKYIELRTVDGHDFWFMGFVNFDKALKNLQAALARGS